MGKAEFRSAETALRRGRELLPRSGSKAGEESRVAASRSTVQIIHTKIHTNSYQESFFGSVLFRRFMPLIRTHLTERFVGALPRSWWVHGRTISRPTFYCDRRSCAHHRTGQRRH